jgi:hypothetical protein
MRQEEIWNVDAAQRYDTLGTGMFAPEVLEPAVDRVGCGNPVSGADQRVSRPGYAACLYSLIMPLT